MVFLDKNILVNNIGISLIGKYEMIKWNVCVYSI